MCEVLAVFRNGFYAWCKRGASSRRQRHRELLSEMKAIHADKDTKCYGSPRMHRELVALRHSVSENTVAKLMSDHSLRAALAPKFKATTDSYHPHPVAENTLNRAFEQESADRVWVADITYIRTGEGWLYLACVLDTYLRKVVGWSMSARITQELVVDALRMELGRRRPDGDAALLHHSDRGSQYASGAYQELLREENISCSMSRKGNCWDNAMMESFFAKLKKQRVRREAYATRPQVRASVFDYIERFYNRLRRHSALGYVSPEQFEAAAWRSLEPHHQRHGPE
ncbi:Integrase core domain protein [Symmachiella macrocystis]|uniref:Integrase core domain protein n=2 Tax=Symmachiella macrocystis TaxID=2527985 RepID=A0A5C6B5C0_9PLAN|nr:Integrase core domain protein [Symmachiella macrocystis]